MVYINNRIALEEKAVTVKEKIIEQLDALSDDAQHRVLEFLRTLASSSIQGVPGKKLLRFAGIINPDELKKIEQAIEEGCERVDPHGW